jgi:hypothetical protein
VTHGRIPFTKAIDKRKLEAGRKAGPAELLAYDQEVGLWSVQQFTAVLDANVRYPAEVRRF